jgi:4,5:9,10-diseco-3-hydroxy-5,9,17-trioxoandrosta-1(10),2-diene-4-oate hydrolase
MPLRFFTHTEAIDACDRAGSRRQAGRCLARQSTQPKAIAHRSSTVGTALRHAEQRAEFFRVKALEMQPRQQYTDCGDSKRDRGRRLFYVAVVEVLSGSRGRKQAMSQYQSHADHFVEIAGIATRYWQTGAGTETVVLIHGFSGSVYEWALNMASLGRSRTVIALDLPGYGKTGKPPVDYDYDFYSTFLLRFFEALGIDRATIFGHSMGAMVAMHFGIRFPELTRRLVLIAPAFAKRFPLFFHLMAVPGLGEYLLRPSRSVRGTEKAFRLITHEKIKYDPACIEQYHQYQHSSGYRQAQLSYVRGVINMFGLTRKGKRYHRLLQKRLPDMPAPSLLIWGKNDRIVPVCHATELRALIARCSFWELDRCGHCPHFEYPDAFNQRVEAFLDSPGGT